MLHASLRTSHTVCINVLREPTAGNPEDPLSYAKPSAYFHYPYVPRNLCIERLDLNLDRSQVLACPEHPIPMLSRHTTNSMRAVSANGHSSSLALKVPGYNCHRPRWDQCSVRDSETCARVTKGQSGSAETGQSQVIKQQIQAPIPLPAVSGSYMSARSSLDSDMISPKICGDRAPPL